MLRQKLLILLMILCVDGLPGRSQTLTSIDSLENQCKLCFTEAKDYLICSKRFYQEMDSLLNVRYRRLRAKCDSSQIENLLDEQLVWLAVRDIQAKKNLELQKRQGIDARTGVTKSDSAHLLFANASFVKTRLIELVNASPRDYSPGKYLVNPTGFYSKGSKIESKDGEIHNYFGDIEVKAIAKSRVVVHLFICKGAPSYNSGELMDTLSVTNNKAVYTTDVDKSCKVIFTFFRRGVMVEQFAEDPNFACGFGHAVDAYGFYRKTSARTPSNKALTEF